MSDRTALLVIDAQESFRHRPYWDNTEVSGYIDRQQALIDGASARGVPVVQIFHVEDTGVFALNSGHVRTIEPLTISPEIVFHKRRHSAFVGTGLDVWLIQHDIGRLIVSGIRTEQCCETTARHGSDIGFSVDYVTEATLTFPMVGANGRAFSPEDIRERTALVLGGRFAHLATVAEALARAEPPCTT